MNNEIRICWSAVDTAELDTNHYPDGMPLVPFPGVLSLFQSTPKRMLVRPSSVDTLMTALWFVDAVRERGGKAPELILPFVPGSRQDRLNTEGDYLFTLKSVAREINLRQFPKVTILDPHSDVAPALIERCEVIHISDILHSTGYERSCRYAAVISPDAGAEKRAGRVAKLLKIPLIRGWKTRDVATGGITGFGMEPIAGLMRDDRVLVVDDICDGGGTFIGLGDVIATADLKADLWTTHGLYSKGTADLLIYYDNIITTDSIARPVSADIVTIDVCKRLLQEGHL